MTNQVENETGSLTELARLVAEVTGEQNLLQGDIRDVASLTKALRRFQEKNAAQVSQTANLRNHYLENILRSMSGLVIVINLRGEIVTVNREVVNRTGFTKDKLEGMHISGLLIDPEEDEERDSLPAFEHNREYRLHCTRASGTSFPVAFTVAPMQNRPGELPSLVCVAHDLSEIEVAENKLRASEFMFRSLVETMLDGVLMVDLKDTILYCNRRFCKMTGYRESELIGKKAGAILLDDSERAKVKERLKQRARRRSEVYDVEIRRKDGEKMWVTVSASPTVDANGKVTGSMGVHNDISFRKESEEQLQSSLSEKEMLIKEIHHRVKNNLQVISSLLSLQTHNVENPQAVEILRDSQNRIKSMAAIHEKLYQSDNLARIDFADYCSQIVYQLAISFGVSARNVEIDVKINDVVLGVDYAVPCGLILNELVSNSIKYAFKEMEGGVVSIQFQPDEDDHYFLAVSDDGCGLPEGIDIWDTPTLGLQLVTTLVEQLDGKLEVVRGSGTRFEIRFPAKEK